VLYWNKSLIIIIITILVLRKEERVLGLLKKKQTIAAPINKTAIPAHSSTAARNERAVHWISLPDAPWDMKLGLLKEKIKVLYWNKSLIIIIITILVLRKEERDNDYQWLVSV
jgi:hypothetical protein